MRALLVSAGDLAGDFLGRSVALRSGAIFPNDAPRCSLGETISASGRWIYVAFASKTHGWVPLESIGKVDPKTTPTPPKFRKPKADGKTA